MQNTKSTQKGRLSLAALLFVAPALLRAGYLVRAQATGAGIDAARGTFYQCLDAFDVGLPGAVASPMRVGHLDTKRNTFAADVAFSHSLHLLCLKLYDPY